MSNDRLWLACKTCGEMRLISKYWGYDWAEYDQSEDLDDWLIRHTSGDQGDEHDCVPRFTAFTEADDLMSYCVNVEGHPSGKDDLWFMKLEKS